MIEQCRSCSCRSLTQVNARTSHSQVGLGSTVLAAAVTLPSKVIQISHKDSRNVKRKRSGEEQFLKILNGILFTILAIHKLSYTGMPEEKTAKPHMLQFSQIQILTALLQRGKLEWEA